MSQIKHSVLIVDDEALIAQALRIHIHAMDLEVCGVAATVRDAISLSEIHRPSIVLMDVRLRDNGDGVQAAATIQKTIGSNIIFITGSREPATITRMNSIEPSGILFKPFSDRQLQAAVTVAMKG